MPLYSAQNLIDPTIIGHRLSLSTSVPFTTADVTAATTIFLVPYISSMLSLYDGAKWVVRDTAGSISIALGTLASVTPHDVYASWNGTSVQLSIDAWTSDTTRAVALTTQNGVLVRTGDATRRYVGTFRTTSTTTTEDSKSKRFVWNQYNRVFRPMIRNETTSSWTYATLAWRQVNGSTANQVEYISGDTHEIEAKAYGAWQAAAAANAAVGIGIDSTTASSAETWGGSANTANLGIYCSAFYSANLAFGYHKVTWLEISDGNTITFIGPTGTAPNQFRNTGLVASVRM